MGLNQILWPNSDKNLTTFRLSKTFYRIAWDTKPYINQFIKSSPDTLKIQKVFPLIPESFGVLIAIDYLGKSGLLSGKYITLVNDLFQPFRYLVDVYEENGTKYAPERVYLKHWVRILSSLQDVGRKNVV